MKVILYNVGRNLNRAYRTCFSFGVEELILIGKYNNMMAESYFKGNLYKAKNKVKIIKLNCLPNLNNTVALENYYSKSIYDVDLTNFDSLLIGGESSDLPKNIEVAEKVIIPTINNLCLTVEASLAIALSEFNRKNYEGTI